MLPAKVEEATLIFEGENLMVKIQPYTSNRVCFLVRFVSGYLLLEQHVLVGDKLTKDNIQEHDFIQHRCRNQINGQKYSWVRRYGTTQNLELNAIICLSDSPQILLA